VLHRTLILLASALFALAFVTTAWLWLPSVALAVAAAIAGWQAHARPGMASTI